METIVVMVYVPGSTTTTSPDTAAATPDARVVYDRPGPTFIVEAEHIFIKNNDNTKIDIRKYFANFMY
jgi:hypothetical protein